MTQWYTIPAKFTSEERRILDVIKEEYGLNHNQTLRLSIEFLARLMVAGEYYARSKNKTLEGVLRISEKYAEKIDSEINEFLKTIPIEQQEKDYEEYSGGMATIFQRFEEIFVKDRKLGRKPLKRKRGRPANKGIE